MNETPHLDRLQDDGTLEAEGVEVLYVSGRAHSVYRVLAALQGDGISWSGSDRPREAIADAMRAAGEKALSEGVISRALRDLQRAGLLHIDRKASPKAREFVYFLKTRTAAGRPYVIRSSEALREARETFRGARIHASTPPSTGEQQHTSQIHEGGCCADQGGAHMPAPTTSSSVVVGRQQQPSQGEQQSHRQQQAPSTAEKIVEWPTDRHAAIAAQLRSKGLSPRLASTVDALARLPDVGLMSFHASNGRHVRGVWERIDFYGPETPGYLDEIVADVTDILIGYPEGAPPCTCAHSVAAAPSTGAAPAASSKPAPSAGDHRMVRRATRAAVRVGAALRVLRGAAP